MMGSQLWQETPQKLVATTRLIRLARRGTLTGWQRRGRLPGPPFDVRPSGVDPIQEAEHPLPHLLGRCAIVLGQVRVGEQVARAGVGVLLEGGPGRSDSVTEGDHLLFRLHHQRSTGSRPRKGTRLV